MRSLVSEFLEHLLESLLNEGIEDARKYYPDIDDNTFNALIRIDPTFDERFDRLGTYGKWILKQYQTTHSLPNSDLRGTLATFDRNKRFYPVDRRDIGKFKSVKDLKDFVTTEEPQMTKSQWNTEHRKRVKKYADEGIEFVGKYGHFNIYIPKTYEASCKLGKYSRWCTAANSEQDGNSLYDKYTETGPLYVLIDERDPKNEYQIHFQSNAFNNAMDAPMHVRDVKKLLEDSPELATWEEETNRDRDGNPISKKIYHVFAQASNPAFVMPHPTSGKQGAMMQYLIDFNYGGDEDDAWSDGLALPEQPDEDDTSLFQDENGRRYNVWDEDDVRDEIVFQLEEADEEWDPARNAAREVLFNMSLSELREVIDRERVKDNLIAKWRDEAEDMEDAELAEWLWDSDYDVFVGTPVSTFKEWSEDGSIPDFETCTWSRKKLIDKYMECHLQTLYFYYDDYGEDHDVFLTHFLEDDDAFDDLWDGDNIDVERLADYLMTDGESTLFFKILSGSEDTDEMCSIQYEGNTYFVIPVNYY